MAAPPVQSLSRQHSHLCLAVPNLILKRTSFDGSFRFFRNVTS